MSQPNPAEVECKFPAGVMEPVIDPERCEAKGPCVAACPYGVLALRTVPAEERRALSLKGRVKLFVHGGKQAYLANSEACRGCALCVQVCPEQAIKLHRRVVGA